MNERIEALRSDTVKRIAELKADLQRWTITVIATVAGILAAVGGPGRRPAPAAPRDGPGSLRPGLRTTGRDVGRTLRPGPAPRPEGGFRHREFPSRTRRSLTARGSRRGTPGEEAGAPALVYADLPGTLVSSGGVEYALYDGMRGTVRIPVRWERFIVASGRPSDRESKGSLPAAETVRLPVRRGSEERE